METTAPESTQVGGLEISLSLTLGGALRPCRAWGPHSPSGPQATAPLLPATA